MAGQLIFKEEEASLALSACVVVDATLAAVDAVLADIFSVRVGVIGAGIKASRGTSRDL